MSFEVDFAILASVPESVLASAKRIADQSEYAAIEIDDTTNVFPRVDSMRGDHVVPVLFYASQKQQMEGETLKVSWLGEYIGYVDAEDGAHPEGDTHLPEAPAAPADEEEEESEEASSTHRYWHVRNLRELSEDERIPIASLESNMQRGIYRRNTVPRRPALVALPRALEQISADS